ncbi:MAG TPA: 2,3-epoxybenzoyl-CoA dihydrolase [Alphaproteobacteria bacterium]|nr:2,3-epoxybenzoyl-CoA dihydrolase [Alphaproteobacteria bacterium]
MTANIVTYDRSPEDYKHWKVSYDGPVATLAMDTAEDGGLRPGYELKLNSYDLGVDIELHDALQRVRFEHPAVKVVVLTSAKDRTFCAGANIRMLASSSHGWKVNFCKFTNETRNGLENLSETSSVKSIAAVNGVCAGGGYELALACDEILMVNDRSSTVSLPEVPLLAVLPGTGGLTRVTDKRKVRRDLADVFCTTAEGVRAERALEWKLVDHIARPDAFEALIDERTAALAKLSDRPDGAKGVALPPLQRSIDDDGYRYPFVEVIVDYDARVATVTVKSPADGGPETAAEIEKLGAAWWPLQMARELDDAILMLRTNNQEVGTILLKTAGEAGPVLAAGKALQANLDNWFVRETAAMLGRTLARLDVSSRSLFAIIDKGSCFAGILAELMLAADRSYMLEDTETPDETPMVVLDENNFGLFTMPNGVSRIHAHYQGDAAAIDTARAAAGKPLDAGAANDLGLVTFTPDELDWDDEVRLAVEERASLSPDALTGMEASLRFGGAETMQTKVFGRLTAWQNWIFNRPNSVGEQGALRLYGTGSKPSFNWERI